GKLARDYPDQVKRRRSVADDVSRLEAHVYPVIGHKPVAAVTLEDCEAVMRNLKGRRKAQLSPSTRRNVALTLSRLLNLAVYPLRLIERSPLPRGFLPRLGKPRALSFLYPSEDAKLLGCVGVPLDRRMLWGLLVREGMRVD